jgi:hypothetical protein
MMIGEAMKRREEKQRKAPERGICPKSITARGLSNDSLSDELCVKEMKIRDKMGS